MRSSIWLSVLLATIVSCDTSETVQPRNDQFFVKYYGADGDQYCSGLVATSDGGYILIGTNDPDKSMALVADIEAGMNGDEDVYITKTDAEGNQEWAQTYDLNALGSDADEGVAIVEGIGGSGYVAVANMTVGGNKDIIVMQLDALGGLVDTIRLGETKNGVPGNETARGLTILDDGAPFYMVAGSTTAAKEDAGNPDFLDYYSIKIDADFTRNTAWDEFSIAGNQTPDYGYKLFLNPFDPTVTVMLGYVDSPNDNDAIWDLNTFGSWEYRNNTDGTNSYFGDTFSQKCQDATTIPGGYLMIGTNEGSQENMYFVRVLVEAENDGSFTYTSAVSTTVFPNEVVEGKAITSSIDGKALVLGTIEYPSADRDIFLGKMDFNGNAIWSQTFGADGFDAGCNVLQNADGSIVFSGTMNVSGQRKICLIKTNSEGELKL